MIAHPVVERIFQAATFTEAELNDALLARAAPPLHRLWLTLRFTEPYARARGYRQHESARIPSEAASERRDPRAPSLLNTREEIELALNLLFTRAETR